MHFRFHRKSAKGSGEVQERFWRRRESNGLVKQEEITQIRQKAYRKKKKKRHF